MNFKDTEIGRIPFEWDVRMIQDVAEVVSGATPKTKVAEYWDGNIAWITPKDLSNHTERYIYRGDRMITDEGLKNSSAKLLPKGSVLFSSRAPIGYTAIAAQELCTNQGFKSMICNQQILDNNFMFYMMNYKKNEIENIAGGSTFKEVSGKTVKEFKIPIPPLDEQKAIAKVLSDLDEKIETNNKINKKLEEMAQAIFKQWFVDFEFTNEDGKPYKSSGGEMVESELGIIPKGWETKKMEEVCVRINSGGTPSRKKEEYYGGDIPWLKTKELLDNFIFNSEEYITEKGLKESSAKVFPRNTVLMAIYASPTVGKLGIASSDVTFNQAMCGMVTNENMLCYEYLYLFLLKERINLNNLASGSAQQNLSVTTIKNYTILVPNIELIKQFKNVISNAFIKIENNSLENIRLSNIRDSILPKLMSGEIRVPMD